jgi:Uma2 family endonuclease
MRKGDFMSVNLPLAECLEPLGRSAGVAKSPPLESGDRLTLDEFLRRYEAMPELKKAELIEGVVYVPSPVRYQYHARQNHHLLVWLGIYEAATPGVAGSGNTTVLLDPRNSPQPDGLLFVRPDHGGQVKFDAEGYIAGAPDLVAEIAASTASYDLHDKLESYRRNGVREYVVCRVFDDQIDWFVLRQNRFELIAPATDGIVRSTVFPGLWLDPAALLRGDIAAVLAVAQHGLNSPEHTEFAARLVQSRSQPAR